MVDLKIGKKVRILTSIYASCQKDQKRNLTKLPVGAVGKVLDIHKDTDGVVYAFLRIFLDGKKYYAKVGPTALGETDQND